MCSAEELEDETSITEREDHLAILAQLHMTCPDVAVMFQRMAIQLLESPDVEERQIMTDLVAQVAATPLMSPAHPQNIEQHMPVGNTQQRGTAVTAGKRV